MEEGDAGYAQGSLSRASVEELTEAYQRTCSLTPLCRQASPGRAGPHLC